MYEWEPEKEVIDFFVTHLESNGLMDRPFANLNGLTPRKLADIIRNAEESAGITFSCGHEKLLHRHIINISEPDEPICDHTYTGREIVKAVEQRNVAGIAFYQGIELLFYSKLKNS